MRKSNDIVYHYCSVETFLSIIQNKCLWLCNIEKSNDSAERKYYEKALIETVNELLTSRLSKQKKEKLDGVLDYLENGLREPLRIHSCSFSSDGDMLSQWRGYADDSTGVAIGFWEPFLIKYGREDSYKKISYNPKQMKRHCKKTILDKLEITHDYPTTHFDIGLLDEMLRDAAFYKSPAFEQECESRFALFEGVERYTSSDGNNDMAIQRADVEILNEESKFTVSERKYRVVNRQLSTYYELGFDKIKDDFIAEIYLGSKCKITPEDIKYLFKDCGYQTNGPIQQIHFSSATYR